MAANPTEDWLEGELHNRNILQILDEDLTPNASGGGKVPVPTRQICFSIASHLSLQCCQIRNPKLTTSGPTSRDAKPRV
jgi:hypothetical protein